jgi:uncharacterized protein (DUF1499 family)
MINNEYYRIYNESLIILYDSFSELLKEKEPFIEHYTLYNNKKITDYMLFVRDFYKNKNNDEIINIKNKSKYISILWKDLGIDEKKKYKYRAKLMLKYFKENFKKQKPKEKKKIEKIKKKEKTLLNKKIRNNILNKIKIKDIEYYIDWNNNLIDINNHEYIGFLEDEIVNFFH